MTRAVGSVRIFFSLLAQHEEEPVERVRGDVVVRADRLGLADQRQRGGLPYHLLVGARHFDVVHAIGYDGEEVADSFFFSP
jgi:hypothetical protein